MQIHDEDGEGCGECDHGHGGHVVLPCGAENVVSHEEEVNSVELSSCLIIKRKKASIWPSNPKRGKM